MKVDETLLVGTLIPAPVYSDVPSALCTLFPLACPRGSDDPFALGRICMSEKMDSELGEPS